MVKINKTLGLALLTALAASCSSDNDVTGTNNPTIDNGEANYATLKIDLPTRAGVRAVDFKDGLASEYAVNDATLLVFKKGESNDEKDFTFVEFVPLGNMNPWQSSTTTGVTTSANITAELKKATLDDLTHDKIYGLVILNNEAANGNKIKLPTENTTTFGAWNDAKNVTAANMTDNSKGIVMANAPEWTTSGQAPTTLVLIHGDKVKPTKAQAEAAGAAADIHVERGLAKVTLAQYGENNTITVDDDNSIYKGCTVKLEAWALDVTNKTSFPVHKTDGLDSVKNYTVIWKSDGTASSSSTVASVNRFVDGANTEFKRVYWGIDPNYSGSDLNTKESLAKCQNAFNMVDESAMKPAFGDDNPQYCLENTFDIDNMTQGQTTRVLIKAEISVPTTKGDDGYLYGDDKYEPGQNLYKVDNDNVDGLLTSYQLSQKISEYILENFGQRNVTVKIDDTAIANTAGFHQLADDNFGTSTSPAKVRTRASGYPVIPDLSEDESKKLFNAFRITTYKNGVCYYVGRIKHFGDDETPWHVGEPTYYDTAKSIDKATGNLKWLGRYGVLRNNWYSLSVGSVSAPGDPEIPQVVPQNPDDDNFNYINLSVNVLNWAKRTDEFDL